MRVEEKKQRTGPSYRGTWASGQAPYARNGEKDELQLLFLWNDYVPGVLFIPPLIFEMILLGRHDYSSFADEKTEGHRG